MRVAYACFGALLGAAFVFPQMARLSPASAAVYAAQQALTPQAIQDFLANPSALLSQYPNGGPQMISRVRDLVASDPATLNPIVSLLATANANQSAAIGTGLGQVALMAVRTDQAYANQIQEAIAASRSRGYPPAPERPGAGSSQAKIGSAVKAVDQVEGTTERGTQPISVGVDVYANELVRTGASGKAELLFADRTNLTVAPVTTIKLDKFVYDPSGGSGNVVIEAIGGAFRFITGVQPSRNYLIKTPVATMGIRGTEFLAVITPDGLKLQVLQGEVNVTSISGQQASVTAGMVVSVSSNGQLQGPTPATQPIVNFADLGPPTTNITLADALDAFAAATGTSATGATGTGGVGGGGEGGGGGSVTAFSAAGISGGGAPPSFSTYVVNTPSPIFTLSFTPTTPFTTTTTTTTTTVTTIITSPTTPVSPTRP